MQRHGRGVLEFYARTARHRAVTRLNALTGRDRHHRIGDHDAVLPPGHKLPWFQAVFPTYDRYAVDVLGTLTRKSSRPLLVDVGANVGDTTLLALSAVPGLEVRAVEGNPDFVAYLRRNTAGIPGVEVVDRFVQVPDMRSVRYATDGSTGGFQRSEADPGPGDEPGTTVDELLAGLHDHDLVIWKSDTDGLDFLLLRENWAAIDAVASVIWFEFDPFLDVEEGAGLPALLDLVRASGRIMHVVDSVGRPMFTTEADTAPSVLAGLADWLGQAAVPGEPAYLDVWLVTRDLAHVDANGRWVLGPA